MGLLSSCIRSCFEKDLSGVLHLEKKSFIHGYDEHTFRYYLNEPSSWFIKAEVDHQIVGYAIYTIRKKEGSVVSMAVRPGFRRRGIGKSLLKEALNDLSLFSKEVELQVGFNNRESIAFYEDAGFWKESIIRRYYVDNEDAIVMKKIFV